MVCVWLVFGLYIVGVYNVVLVVVVSFGKYKLFILFKIKLLMVGFVLIFIIKIKENVKKNRRNILRSLFVKVGINLFVRDSV